MDKMFMRIVCILYHQYSDQPAFPYRTQMNRMNQRLEVLLPQTEPNMNDQMRRLYLNETKRTNENEIIHSREMESD